MQNLDWFFEKNFLNKNDIKLEYLKCMNELLQYSGKIFLVYLLVSGAFIENSLLIKNDQISYFKGPDERSFYNYRLSLWNSHVH